MSLCPKCGRAYCDHTPAERGQTHQEMMRALTPEEMRAWQQDDSKEKLRLAQANAHLPVDKNG